MTRLSTEETAARLGVKRETVYAYVSRGILSRKKAVDGKASTFDADEVDRLRRRRLGDHPGRLEAPVTTSIAEVRDGVVAFRGQPITDLAAAGTTYEQVAELLWDVPHIRPWVAPRHMTEALALAMSQLPAEATLIDQLLAGTVMASAHDPFRNDRSRESAATSMRNLIASTAEALPLRKAATFKPSASIADRLWPRLTTAPRSNAHVLDRTLMLMADHGMASSTIAARIAASTRAGVHAAVIAGLGALNGPLHGAASRSVHELLIRAERDGTEAAIAAVLRDNTKVPGIGHFVHRTSDPRFKIMMRSIGESTLNPARIDIVHRVIDRTADRINAPHNIDFSLGSLTFVAGMEPDAGELIFAIARIAGWVAHALEEYDEAPLRFRPIGRYNSLRPRPAPAGS
ncbi:MAG: citrate synthase [Verrucomicrobiales bacterium]|jgi:citrate synthase